MSPEKIFFVIQKAKEDELKTGHFVSILKNKINEPHLIIGVNGGDPVHCLYDFSVEYIEMAPRLIEFVDACAKEAGEEDLLQPFIQAAINYFAQPSILFPRYTGLAGLLIKAYLCHRLMEEMYDNNRSIRNSSLYDTEITQANLLAHHLIGEPFANELDEATQVTLCRLVGSPGYFDLDLNPFVRQAKNKAWGWMHNYWQGLLERNHIRFNFSSRIGHLD
ncbi:MAG: hypothetical protein CSA52_02710 [Gammaproteobacteria bacterium]|nr:MAG: hypothetical protein CSB48_04380 [Pseudomonadota bacterium]PIE38311.1 MAG: hypothetical protein CSA52_02710 [Gammaproteobacteria bacterium]